MRKFIISYRAQIFIFVLMLTALAFYTIRLPSYLVGTSTDDGLYVTLAKSISQGDGFRRIDLPGAPLTTFVPFGYPLLLSLLVKISPHNYLPLKLLSVVFSIGSIYLTWILYRKNSSPLIAATVTLLFALNWGAIGTSYMVMSEPAFIFFILLSMIFIRRYVADSKPLTWNWLALIIFSAFSYFIRIPGLILITSTVIYFIYRKIFLKLIAYSIGVGVIIGAWSARNWLVAGSLLSKEYQAGSLSSGVSNYIHRSLIGLQDLFYALPDTIIPILGPRTITLLNHISPLLTIFYYLAIWGVVLTGFLIVARKKFWVTEIYVPLSLLLIVFSGLSQIRYVVPLLPFLYYYLVEGLLYLFSLRIFLPRGKIKPEGALIMIVLLITILNLGRGIQGILHPHKTPDITLGATWIRDNTPLDTIVMTRIPRVTFIYAERPGVTYPYYGEKFDVTESYGSLAEMEPGESLEWAIQHYHVNYLLVAPLLEIVQGPLVLDDYENNFLIPYLRQHPEEFMEVYANPKQLTFVYQVVER